MKENQHKKIILGRGFPKLKKVILFVCLVFGAGNLLHAQDYDKNYFMLSLTPGIIVPPDIPNETKKFMSDDEIKAVEKKHLFFDIRAGWTHNFCRYIGWDVFSAHLIPTTAKGSIESLPVQLMSGVRGYVPISGIDKTVFGAFDMGAGANVDNLDAIGLCFEFETGISLTKKFFVAGVVNYQSNKTDNVIAKRRYCGVRLGFHF